MAAKIENPRLEVLLSRLKQVTKTSNGWEACCPSHDDTRPSLSIRAADDGKILLKCHSNGCHPANVMQCVGLSAKDMFPPKESRGKSEWGELVATYSYCDENGAQLFEVCRFEKIEKQADGSERKVKTFRQRHKANGEWVWKMTGVRRVLYRLPQLLAAKDEPVFLCEGEKQVEYLVSLGHCATCNPQGAGKWRDEFAESLRGRDVIIVPDNDPVTEKNGKVSCVGMEHAEAVADSLTGKAKSVYVLILPGAEEKWGLDDWLQKGSHDLEELEELIAEAPAWVYGSKLFDRTDSDPDRNGVLRDDAVSQTGRQVLLPAGTRVRAKDRNNFGEVVCDEGGDTVTVHFTSPDGQEATKDIPRKQLARADGSSVVQVAIVSPPMRSARDLIGGFKKLRPPLIYGLLREGETMNIIAATKCGKSWLATLLALEFATLRKWLGRFETAGGDVLIVDNELHAETSAYRIPAVATANETHLDEYADHVFVMNLRGELVSLPDLAVILSAIAPGRFKLIILDAFYRFLPPGTDENDNGAMAALYNLLDQIAGKAQCSIVCIHHSSKGNQAGKSVTDVGSGAGSMSRAADCHVILRPHEQANVVVMEAAARSWPPLDPFCLRWDFPIFSEDTSFDPTLLRPERPKRTPKSETEKTPSGPAWTHQRFAAEFVGEAPQLRDAILAKAVDAGLAERRAEKLFQYAEGAGLIHAWPNFVKKKRGFANVPPIIDTPEKNTHIPP